MKNKFFVVSFLMIVLLSFSLISCSQQADITSTTKVAETTITTKATTTTIYSSDTKYGLTEIQRKQAFYELVELQDSISLGDPDRNEKLEEAYSIIAKKYDITKEEMKQIGIEGIEKNWPMPEID